MALNLAKEAINTRTVMAAGSGLTGLSFGHVLYFGGMAGAGSSLFSVFGDIMIKGEDISFGQAFVNVVKFAALGAMLAGIGYQLSKAFAALKLKLFKPNVAEGAGNVDSFIKNNIDIDFQQNVKNAFSSDVKVTTLTQDTTAYRYYGGDSSVSSYWVTPNKVANPISELSLPLGNTAQYVDSIVIPKGITILEGTVAPNFGQLGGGYQFYVPNLK